MQNSASDCWVVILESDIFVLSNRCGIFDQCCGSRFHGRISCFDGCNEPNRCCTERRHHAVIRLMQPYSRNREGELRPAPQRGHRDPQHWSKFALFSLVPIIDGQSIYPCIRRLRLQHVVLQTQVKAHLKLIIETMEEPSEFIGNSTNIQDITCGDAARTSLLQPSLYCSKFSMNI